MSKTTLRTEKRMITLPVVCWEEIDKLKNGYTIKSHGHALLAILIQIYPTLADKIQQEAKGQTVKKKLTDTPKQPIILPDGKDLCTCGHPRGGHVDNKCIVHRCTCELFQIDIEATNKAIQNRKEMGV